MLTALRSLQKMLENSVGVMLSAEKMSRVVWNNYTSPLLYIFLTISFTIRMPSFHYYNGHGCFQCLYGKCLTFPLKTWFSSATRKCPMLPLRPSTFLLKSSVAESRSNQNVDKLINGVTLLKPVGPSASFSLFSHSHLYCPSEICIDIAWESEKSLHKIRVSNRHPGLSTVLQSIQDMLTEAKMHLGATTK